MSTPVGPQGAHARLQHSPPHVGMPPSLPSPAAPAPHTSPASLQLVAPGALGVVHRPTEAPEAFTHSPAQHSASVPHASPVCVQNDGAPEQRPLSQ